MDVVEEAGYGADVPGQLEALWTHNEFFGDLLPHEVDGHKNAESAADGDPCILHVLFHVRWDFQSDRVHFAQETCQQLNPLYVKRTIYVTVAKKLKRKKGKFSRIRKGKVVRNQMSYGRCDVAALHRISRLCKLCHRGVKCRVENLNLFGRKIYS